MVLRRGAKSKSDVDLTLVAVNSSKTMQPGHLAKYSNKLPPVPSRSQGRQPVPSPVAKGAQRSACLGLVATKGGKVNKPERNGISAANFRILTIQGAGTSSKTERTGEIVNQHAFCNFE